VRALEGDWQKPQLLDAVAKELSFAEEGDNGIRVSNAVLELW
jgi:hypothetical protein